MPRKSYALRACDYCDAEMPGNELIGVTDRVVAGVRQGSRSYFSTRGTIGRGTSSSTYYKVNHLKICRECYEQRAAAIRRQRFLNFLGTCVVLAVIAGIIVAVIAIHPNTGAPANTAEFAPDNMAEADNSALPADSPAVADAPTASDAQPAPNASASSDVPVATVDNRTQEYQRQPPMSAPHDFRDDYARAINEVTPTALETGQPERWEAAAGKGYVVPSSPQSYGTQTCRNVYSTIFYGDQQSQSAPVRWCRDGDGGDWHLAN